MAKEKVQNKDEIVKTRNPLVFISHDTRDAKLAEAFSGLLKSVSAGVLKSFRTSDRKGNQGIEYGVEWYPEIIKNIQNASDVVCLLTERSIDRPWILFEAGMAKGKLETPILGVALGISLKNASSGPFAQFQNCGDDEESLTKLVFQLVDRIPNSEPDEDTIKFQVGNFKKTIENILKDKNAVVKPENTKSSKNDNSSAKLFEEIKVMFQDLPSRIENNIRPESINRKRRRFHPMMFEEMMEMSKNRYIGIMMALSLFKETMPWLYEIGMDTIRTVKDGKTKAEKKRAFIEFQEIVEMSTRHPMMREYFMDSKDDYFLFRDLPMMLLKNIEMIMMNEK
ncbi:MAG: toll/interleukin-1 receptor domain-containing protein [Candidatus Electrothrix communis]|nr:MAG: toll/interleukin-1 receptor domain-containing protein [Candidatus Electrothrix communis]